MIFMWRKIIHIMHINFSLFLNSFLFIRCAVMTVMIEKNIILKIICSSCCVAELWEIPWNVSSLNTQCRSINNIFHISSNISHIHRDITYTPPPVSPPVFLQWERWTEQTTEHKIQYMGMWLSWKFVYCCKCWNVRTFLKIGFLSTSWLCFLLWCMQNVSDCHFPHHAWGEKELTILLNDTFKVVKEDGTTESDLSLHIIQYLLCTSWCDSDI